MNIKYSTAVGLVSIIALNGCGGGGGAAAPTLSQQILSDSPVAYYRLNDASGSAVAADSSGHNLGGVVSGDMTMGVSDGTGGVCALFGTSSAVRVADPGPASVFPSANSFSVEAWFLETTALGYSPALVDKGHNLQPGSWALSAGTASIQSSFVNQDQGESTGGSVTAPSALTTGVWHQLVQTTDVGSGFVNLYIDGSLVASSAFTSRPTSTNTIDLQIGVITGVGLWFTGKVSDVAVFNGPLSLSRIQAHWLAGHK